MQTAPRNRGARTGPSGDDGLRRSAALVRRLGWAAVAASAALGVVFWRALPGTTSTPATATVPSASTTGAAGGSDGEGFSDDGGRTRAASAAAPAQAPSAPTAATGAGSGSLGAPVAVSGGSAVP